ncbi:hypothetical protein K9M74_01975 [Candidatus Woesearchaeota archaeon]|nr:hypothetical protein [Candidatus Woesearchaeota archaeon]
MRFKVAPLSGTFMLVSIFGFVFSVMVLSKVSPTWAFTIGFLSVAAFTASMISMTYAPVEAELALDEHHTNRKTRVRIEKPARKKKR